MNEGIQFNTTSFEEQLSDLKGWVDGQTDGGVKRCVSLVGTSEGNGCYSYTQLLLFSSGSHFVLFFFHEVARYHGNELRASVFFYDGNGWLGQIVSNRAETPGELKSNEEVGHL